MSKSLPLTVPAVLLGAAKLLRDRGWTTGRYYTPDGRLCLVGAIQHCVAEAGVDPVERCNLIADATYQLTRTIWALPSGAEELHATAWNDRQCTSTEEAIAVLERAAQVVA